MVARTNVGLDWLERSCSAAAQQLSACACVTVVRWEPTLCDTALCIGQAMPSVQHAIRASGVGAHPAQTAALPANKTRLSAATDMRRTNVNTVLRMRERSRGVKPG